MQTLLDDESLKLLEQRADAERLAELAGIAEHPWRGSRKELERALKALEDAREKEKARTFALAVAAYTDLLAKLPAADDALNRSFADLDAARDGEHKKRQLHAFLASDFGKEYTLERRSARGDFPLPRGFTQADLDRIAAFEAADAAHRNAVGQHQVIASPIAAMEEQYPALRDLRDTVTKPALAKA